MKRMAFCDTTTGIRLKERVTESCASLSKYHEVQINSYSFPFSLVVLLL